MSFIVGIAGGTASGKSTISSRVRSLLGSEATFLSHDDYYKSIPAHLVSDPDLAFKYNFDHPDALDSARMVDHLAQLRSGVPIRRPQYDYASAQSVPDAVEVSPSPIILVDGILLLAIPAIRNMLNLSIFVSCPDDIRLLRRIRRDTTERGLTLDYTLRLYERTVRPMHNAYVAPSEDYAHLTVSGDQDTELVSQRIVDMIRVARSNQVP